MGHGSFWSLLLMLIPCAQLKMQIHILLDAIKEADLEVNAEKNNRISRQQIHGKNINTANIFFETMANFIHFRITIRKQICILGEVHSKLNFGKACSHSVQNLSYRLLLKT